MKFCVLLLATIGTLALQPVRADWHCQNDLEVHCDESSCELTNSDEATAMAVSFSESGRFSVCAYSGCWSGLGTVVSLSPFLVITSEKAEWSFPPDRTANAKDVLIAFDPSDKVALVKVSGWAIPFRCETNPARDGN